MNFIQKEAKSLTGAALWWIISRQVQFLAPKIVFPLEASDTYLKCATGLDLSSMPAECHENQWEKLSRLHKCDRRQTDRQTTLRRNV